jgi:hypothetical protein
LALACSVYGALRFGDLGDISAMTEDISQDHPDHMRIVNSLPDCGAHGFDHKPRIGMSRSIFCKACDQGVNVSPDPPRALFVQRIGRRART